MDKILPLTFP